jgi:ADP-heptose:LPS heptosyltransferase
MDILIVKLGALGDVINTLPLVVRLKTHFKAKIHWLVAPLSYPIVSKHPYVDQTILFEKSKWRSSVMEVKTTIQAQRFDLVLDLQRILKSSTLCMFAKSPRRIGFDRKRCKEMTWLFPFERIPESDPSSHMLLQYLEFATYLGVKDNHITWEISSSPTRPSTLPDNYVVLNIGATKPANKWTVQGFASLTDDIAQKFDFSCVITGGKEDREMAEQIESLSSCKLINMAGRTSIDELKDVLQHAKAVVTCDTGPMHLAVALGKEVIALFGPSDPKRTGPFKGHVIQKNLPCVPCNKKSCETPLCMTKINSKDVMKKLIVLLNNS